MKSIFGANPTEGERKILLDIAGSSSKPAKVREGIFNRAMMAAENRKKFNAAKAEELRGGTYFKPKSLDAVGGGAATKDQQALAWANANPNDPRSAQIKQRLGVK